MMKLIHLFENYALAKEALRHWPHDADTLDESLTHFRISSNAVYPYRCEGQLCFLRLAPTEEKLEINLAGELAFLAYLQARDFPALRIIPTKDNAPYMLLHTAYGDYYASAFQGVAGKPIEDLTLSPALLQEYGRTLGWLHNLSSSYEPTQRKWTYLDALDWIDAVLLEYHAPQGVMSASHALREALKQIPTSQATYGLVHYDFEPDNVFYNEETHTCAVIDFDDAMYHWYVLDIEQVVDSLRDLLSEEKMPEAVSSFLAGYRTMHPYTEEMEASRSLMHRFITLYGYARLIRSVAERFDDEPDWLVRLRKKLDNTIARKETELLQE